MLSNIWKPIMLQRWFRYFYKKWSGQKIQKELGKMLINIWNVWGERFVSILFTALPQLLQISLPHGSNPTNIFEYINEWIGNKVYKYDLLKSEVSL